MIPISAYLGLSVILFAIGLVCLIAKKNMLRLLMGLEILLNAVNINFLVFAVYGVSEGIHPEGQVFVIITISLGGCILAVGMTLILYAYRHYKTLNVRKLRRLRW